MRVRPIIELQDVWRVYHMGKVEVPAVRGISTTIGKREFIAIVGASGSGKSTLMHMIGALDIPTRGRVLLEGQDVAKMNRNTLAKVRGKKMGFVFQQFNLVPNMNAAENVELPMVFQGVSSSEREEEAGFLLKLVGLGGRERHRPGELSGGEQQRVAIARALTNNPDVVLADEPTGNLDSKTGREIIGVLDRLNKEEGKTIVMVTHDAKLASMADRRIYLKDGEIERRGR